MVSPLTGRVRSGKVHLPRVDKNNHSIEIIFNSWETVLTINNSNNSEISPCFVTVVDALYILSTVRLELEKTATVLCEVNSIK